jgi:hypothetical protein
MVIAYTTAAGQVRLLISDVNEAAFVFDDDMIAGFLATYGLGPTDSVSTVRRGLLFLSAADALDTIATSEALVGKVIRTGDGLQTDGAKLADALRRQADSLRKRADKEEADSDGSFWGVAEFKPDAYSREAVEG